MLLITAAPPRSARPVSINKRTDPLVPSLPFFLLIWLNGRAGRNELYPCQGRPGFERLVLSASIFFNRALSFTAVLQIVQSRRGVNRASMKSSGRSGPHW